MANNNYDVAIIGAGIIGCSIAWEFMNRGANIVVFDGRPQPFQGSSLAGFGSLTPFSDPFFSGEAQEFAAESVDLYRDTWIRDISQRSGVAIPFVDLGLIELCINEEDLKKAKKHAENLSAGKRSSVARVLTVSETRELEPNLSDQFSGALWLDEPWIDKEVYFDTLGRILRSELHDDFRLSTQIRTVQTDGAAFKLVTDHGLTVRSRSVVLCTGLNAVGVEGLPQTPTLKWVRGDAIAVHTTDDRPLIQRHIYRGNGFITPRLTGYMLLGATYDLEDGIPSERARQHRDRIGLEQFKSLIENNEKILPGIANCEVEKVWRNWRPTPPDNIPVLGPLAEQSQLVVATGYIGLGITMAPATAVAIADYCLEGKDNFPKTFSPTRFVHS
jgi:glycine oxidase